jgi:hypothetical protein
MIKVMLKMKLPRSLRSKGVGIVKDSQKKIDSLAKSLPEKPGLFASRS